MRRDIEVHDLKNKRFDINQTNKQTTTTTTKKSGAQFYGNEIIVNVARTLWKPSVSQNLSSGLGEGSLSFVVWNMQEGKCEVPSREWWHRHW